MKRTLVSAASTGGVILDRDGTIIKECNYLSEPDRVELLPGAANGLRRLSDAGLKLIVITNQSGIARGYLTADRLDAIHSRMRDLLTREGVTLDAIYYCPHLPTDSCDCRKPRPRLLYQAAADVGFSLSRTFVIGDKPCDIELGASVGVPSILVRTGYGAEYEASGYRHATYIADNLCEAARWIIQACESPVLATT